MYLHEIKLAFLQYLHQLYLQSSAQSTNGYTTLYWQILGYIRNRIFEIKVMLKGKQTTKQKHPGSFIIAFEAIMHCFDFRY